LFSSFPFLITVQGDLHNILSTCLQLYAASVVVGVDCGRVHGDQHDSAVHGILTGRTEEQPSGRGTTTDPTAGDEPHVCSTGENATPSTVQYCCFGLVAICVSFSVSLEHVDVMLLVLLGLVLSVASQEIGWEEHPKITRIVLSGM